MEITIDTLIAVAGLFIGGGGGAFFTWRWQRKKAQAEAETAEAEAAKEMQDMYQQLIADVKADRADQREYIDELKSDRNHYREERNMLRDQIEELAKKVRSLQEQVDRNGRQLDCLRPLLCGRAGCADRINVIISTDGDVKPKAKKQPKKNEPEITPYGGK